MKIKNEIESLKETLLRIFIPEIFLCMKTAYI